MKSITELLTKLDNKYGRTHWISIHGDRSGYVENLGGNITSWGNAKEMNLELSKLEQSLKQEEEWGI